VPRARRVREGVDTTRWSQLVQRSWSGESSQFAMGSGSHFGRLLLRTQASTASFLMDRSRRRSCQCRLGRRFTKVFSPPIWSRREVRHVCAPWAPGLCSWRLDATADLRRQSLDCSPCRAPCRLFERRRARDAPHSFEL